MSSSTTMNLSNISINAKFSSVGNLAKVETLFRWYAFKKNAMPKHNIA